MLKELAVALLVPPANLLPIALLGLALAARGPQRRRRLGHWATGLALAAMWLLSLPAVAALLTVALETGLDQSPPGSPPAGAIVILSAESREFGPGGILVGDDVGPLTLERMRAGAALHRRTGLPMLVTGGTLSPGQPAIARTMALVMQRDFDLPVRWVEPRSDDTWENAAFSAALLHADGVRAIQLVTHAWHMPRAVRAFARQGLAVTAAPVALDLLRLQPRDFILPTAGAWQRSAWAVHEWIGLLAYRLRERVASFPAAPV